MLPLKYVESVFILSLSPYLYPLCTVPRCIYLLHKERERAGKEYKCLGVGKVMLE